MKKVFLQWAHQNRVLDVSLHCPGSVCTVCAGEAGAHTLCNEITRQDLLLPLEGFLQKHKNIAAFITAHQGGNGEVWLTKVRDYLRTAHH